jgi:hypothetical protein
MTAKRLLCAMCLLFIAAVVVPAIYASPAVVIKDAGLCGMPGSDADGNIIFGGIGNVTHDVINDNHEVFKCKGEGLTNLSGKGQSFKDFGCGTFSGVTTDTHATVAKNGNGTMTCKVTF